jgi:hypothetical protein
MSQNCVFAHAFRERERERGREGRERRGREKGREREYKTAGSAHSSEMFLTKYKTEFCLSLSHPILSINVILRRVRVTIFAVGK